ncbi:hypothetical protein [Rodentibacter mrazii]|uniref:hypothetical protein n=1 Tax=Rodentibacter mrazii TaxID=1908257 RepID=UPI00117BAE8D|nr:hypothetical protein [Rodentibacter mrazii]
MAKVKIVFTILIDGSEKLSHQVEYEKKCCKTYQQHFIEEKGLAIEVIKSLEGLKAYDDISSSDWLISK